MTISLKHAFQSAVADGDDDNLVQPSDWNDEHLLEMDADKLLGRATAGTGAAEEIDCTAFGRSLLAAANAAAGRTALALGTMALEAASDYAKSAVIAAGYQPISANLTSLSSASANGVSLVTAANYAAMRALLDLEPGTDFYSKTGADAAFQPIDATLSALAGLTVAADKLAYATGADQFATTDLTSFARTLLDDANASAARTTLGLVIGTDVQAYDAELAALAGVTSAADKVPYFTGAGTADTATLTSFARTILDDADAAAARTTLGLGTIATAAASDYLSAAAAAAGYQPLASALTSWAAITRASGFDAFAATPSSANLRALLSDETGTGAAVFATSPTFSTSIAIGDWTITPTAIIGSSGTPFDPVLNITNSSADATGPLWQFNKKRGVGAAVANDFALWFQAAGMDGGGTLREGGDYQMQITAVGTGSSTVQMQHLWTTANGTNTAVRMTLHPSGFLDMAAGSFGRGAPVTKTANFTVAATENFLINNKAGSACTVTLPTASSWTGREITIKTIQAQTVVSASSNVVPLAGGAAGTAILAATAGRWATLVSNGTNWEIVAAG